MSKKTRQLTPFGLEVRKALLEKGLSIVDLANAIGARPGNIRDMLYGEFPGIKYKNKIEKFLDLQINNEREAAANE